VLLEEVMREMLEEEADDAYEEAEEAARKKQLPPEQLKFVLDALHGGPESDVLVQKFNVDITRRHLQCMLPLQWLNDEVINFWFQLLNDRDEALVKSGALSKRSHFFNSFFYTKVSEGGYNFVNVRRWTRKVRRSPAPVYYVDEGSAHCELCEQIDLFAMDKIFVPVNVSNVSLQPEDAALDGSRPFTLFPVDVLYRHTGVSL
jgi:Ulp1 family protease